MEVYRCFKPLLLERYDEDGRSVPGRSITVEPGTLMVRRGQLRIAGPNGIRLEGDDGLWVEMMPYTLVEYFAPVRE